MSKSEATLWAILGNLPVPMVAHEIDGEGVVRFVNESFTCSFGYTLADVPNLRVWAERAYPDPDYRAEAFTQWWAEIAARKEFGSVAPPSEYTIKDKAGQSRDVLIGFALHGDLVIVTFQDLTQTHKTEAALEAERRRNEKTAFALTENMPAGAYTMVLRPGAELAEFAFLSKKFLQMLELTREEAVGNPMTGFSRVHPEDRPGWIERNAEAFSKRKPFSGEARIVANGETRWIRAESVPRELHDGSVIWEGILVDIDDLKRTKQKLQTVLEAAHAFTWTLDLQEQMIEFDQNWAIAQGFDPDQTVLSVGDWFATLHPEDAGHVAHALEILRNGSVERHSVRYRRRRPDGSWRWLQAVAGRTARDADGRPTALSGVSFDITEEMVQRANALEEQAQLREELQRAQQQDTIAQVAGGVAHDLNNLIAVIAGTAEIMELQAHGEPTLMDGLDRIRRSVRMARDLITGLGGLVRRELPRGAYDMGKLLRDATDLLGQRRIERHAISIDLAEGYPPVWANPTEVAQVLVNLAINACDSGTPDKPAKVRLAALPTGTPLPGRAPDAGELPPGDVPVALFTVSDTGLGIPDDVRARMFRPHFTTKGDSGTGLGLLIISTILQTNRAALWVDTVCGRGTTITVAWPSTSLTVAGRVPGRVANAVEIPWRHAPDM